MAKIDLEELERKARDADVGVCWRLGYDDPAAIVTDNTACTIAVADPSWACDRHLIHALHIAANGPPVTLALIARIRELEGVLLEKGAVVP